ncbi:MAG: MFS transporter [bacterium]|nr:MFS transporter [bacterium]
MKGWFSPQLPESDPRYYGWLVVGTTFFTLAIGGSIVGTFPVFYVAFLDEFGWSRADTALAFSASMVTFALSAGAIGALIDRWGPRRVIPAGIGVLAAGLALMSTLSNLPALYVYYGLVVALGVTLIGFIPTSAVVHSWFLRRRSTALGLALSGRSFGNFVMIPLAAYLIGWVGWRSAYLLLGAGIFILLFPLNFAFHRPVPAVTKKAASQSGEEDWTLLRALSNSTFWLLFLAGIFAGVSFSIVGVHQVAHMVDVGISRIAAASFLGGMAVLRAMGGIGGGWLADRTGRSSAYVLSTLFGMLGILCLMWLTAGRLYLAYFFIFFYGLGAGARATVFVSLKADAFPGRSFGKILGFSQMGSGLASGVGPWLAGYLFDVQGNYQSAFWLTLAMNVFTVIAVLMGIRPARKPQASRIRA